MTPVILEVVAPMLSNVEMSCRGCGVIMDSLGLKKQDRQACTAGYPEDWKDAVEHLTAWIAEISRLYRHRILIRIIDAHGPLEADQAQGVQVPCLYCEQKEDVYRLEPERTRVRHRRGGEKDGLNR